MDSSPATLRAMMQLGDDNADGDVDFDEFCGIMKRVQAAEAIQKSFKNSFGKRGGKRGGKMADGGGSVLSAAGVKMADSGNASAPPPPRRLARANTTVFVSRSEEEAAAAEQEELERSCMAEWVKWISRVGVAQVVMGALQVCVHPITALAWHSHDRGIGHRE